MRLAIKLEEWQAAGLIDGASATAIRAHENGRQRPVAAFTVVALGLLALALGIISLVAANWDQLSATVKLVVSIALMASAAGASLVYARRDRRWMGESTVFLLAALTLAEIALQSQIYQLNGPSWMALAWWAVLVSPAILLLGRTRLVAYGYSAMLVALAVAYRMSTAGLIGQALSAALPVAFVFVALALPPEERNASFRDGLFEIGLVSTLLAASVAHIGWGSTVTGTSASTILRQIPVAAVLVIGASVLVFRQRSRADAEFIVVALAGSLLAVVFALGLPHGGGPAARFVGVLSFLALWGALAVLATRAGWHRMFRFAIAALAVRLFLVYYELFYSLVFTGAGLIIGGVLLIALSWVWTRVVRREAR